MLLSNNSLPKINLRGGALDELKEWIRHNPDLSWSEVADYIVDEPDSVYNVEMLESIISKLYVEANKNHITSIRCVYNDDINFNL